MDKVFIYFGIDKFKNVHDICLLTPVTDCPTHFFSHLKLPSFTPICDVYIGWLSLLFNIDGEIHLTGFWKSECKKDVKKIFSNLKHSKIMDISCGLKFSYVITTSGECYFFSNNTLELDSLPNSSKIKSIVTEDLHDIALTEDGKVFIIKFEDKLFLEELIIPIPVKGVACGKEHVLLLTNSGTIFSYGSGSRGQLGLGSIENQNKPVLIEALDGLKIEKISAGGWHSAAISDSGDLYMWGWNESGQLGLPCNELQGKSRPLEEIETVCCLPKIIELEEEMVKEVGCGSRHTAAITENNHLWTWGWNGYGQLGHTELPLSDKPEKVKLPDSFHPLKLKCKFWSTLVIGHLKLAT